MIISYLITEYYDRYHLPRQVIVVFVHREKLIIFLESIKKSEKSITLLKTILHIMSCYDLCGDA